MSAISITKMNMLDRCGMQYYYRYEEGLAVPPGVAVIRGIGTHRAIEADLKNKIETGELLPGEQVADIARDAVNAEWEQSGGPRLTDDERDEGGDRVRGKTVDGTVRLASLYHDRVAPEVMPSAVEQEFTLKLPDGLPDLRGVIDIMAADKVADVKTVSKTPPSSMADQSTQLTAYALAAWRLGGPENQRVEIHALIDTNSPKELIMESVRDKADYKRFIRRVERYAEVIQNGAFLPAPEDSWVCSSRWCGYYDHICPFGRRGRARHE